MGFSDRVLRVLSDTNAQEIFANIDVEFSDVDAGKSGSAGTIDIFPGTVSTGKTQFTVADNSGDTTTTITTAQQAAARTYTIPDAGSSCDFMMTAETQTISGVNTHSANVILNDAIDLALGTSSDTLLRFSTADSSNNTTVLALDDTSQQMHVTDKAAVATDWARSAGTHPELSIHSNTTPITDYLAIGNHDGTTASIDVVGGTTLDLNIAGTTAVAISASGTLLLDGIDHTLGTGSDVLMRFSTADADNNAFVIAIDDASQQMHITDKGAVATDWNVSAGTHPNLFIHSNTTPATDYITIGNHDGTTATIDVVGGTTLALAIAGTAPVSMTATTFTFISTCFPVLPITDTDGTVEGSIWYDASEDKLKFKPAGTVETITSS